MGALQLLLGFDDETLCLGEDSQQLEVEENVWSKFGEGWERKGGEEVAEKWWRRGVVPDGLSVVGMCRPVDERTVGKLKERKKREKREGENDG